MWKWLWVRVGRVQQRRVLHRMIDRQPASHPLVLIELISTFGRWWAGLNGVGFTISAALMVTVYASLLSASNVCLASQFVSDTLNFGRKAATAFMIGGLFALITSSLPMFIGFYRNDRRVKRLEDPLPIGRELDGFTNGQAYNVAALQLILLFVSISQFTLTDRAAGALWAKGRLTPTQIQTMRQGFEKTCNYSP
jgi:hypothetical protein